MPLWGIAVVFAAVYLVFALLHAVAKKKRPLKRALVSMCAGPLLMTAINLLSGVTQVSLPVSLLSIVTSVAGGVPGVTLLLFLNLIV